jgi:formyl-CoA transferase
MVSVSGYGQTGPYAHQPAFDRIALAFAGMLNITGFADRAPIRPGVAVADYQSALFGAFAALMALYHRDVRAGGGQHIDVSLFESVFRFTDILVTAADKLGIKRSRQGNLHFAAAPGDHFETCDGRYIVITISNDSLFAKLADAMGMPGLKLDERFASHDARWQNIKEVNAIVGEWIRTNPVDRVLSLLKSHGLPHSLIYGVDEILSDPHYAARNAIASIDHPRLGELKMPSPTPRLSKTPALKIRPAPELGAHNTEILGDRLGLNLDGLKRLKDLKII